LVWNLIDRNPRVNLTAALHPKYRGRTKKQRRTAQFRLKDVGNFDASAPLLSGSGTGRG
jgi:hypothetical protein